MSKKWFNFIGHISTVFLKKESIFENIRFELGFVLGLFIRQETMLLFLVA